MSSLMVLGLQTAKANPTDAPRGAETFQAGARAFQQGQFGTAKQSFFLVLSQYQDHVDSLYNLGLIALKEDHLGYAIGLWRKALYADPTNERVSTAIQYATNKLKKAGSADDSELPVGWAKYRVFLLPDVPTLALIIASALLLLSTGWFGLRWLGKKKFSLRNELPAPDTPVAVLIMAIVFVLLLVSIGATVYDRSILRGTVIEKSVTLLTAPDLNATAIRELSEGVEVDILGSKLADEKNWLLVASHNGDTGWIPGQTVLSNREENPEGFDPTRRSVKP